MAGTTGEQAAGRTLSSATQRLVGELDDVFWAIYQAVDEAQRRTVDLTVDVATFEAFRPEWMDQTVRTASDQCADVARVFGSVRGLQRGYRELVNKLEVFDLVRHPRRFVGPDAATDANVPRLIEIVSSLPPFQRIWAIEGLGHDYADWARAHVATARLLVDGTLPTGVLPMMHAGLGLSVADDVLRGATPFDDERTWHTRIQAFREGVDRMTREGYAGCAFESLGLVARTLHYPVIGAIDQALARGASDLRPYFWHGVGRGLYFSPLQFVPGVSSPWARLVAETGGEVARPNATAGLAWATALVNMRHPEIVATLVASIGGAARRDDAVATGIACAFAMAIETDPSNPFARPFLQYEPEAESQSSWRRAVPSHDEVMGVLESARQTGRLERLFMYAPREMASGRGGRA